jgi:hypothetical protein
MTSLIASNEYNPTAYRVMLDFIVSSAQLGEKHETKARR